MNKFLFVPILFIFGCVKYTQNPKIMPLLTTVKEPIKHPHGVSSFPTPVCAYVNEWDTSLFSNNRAKLGCWCMIGPLSVVDSGGTKRRLVTFIHSDEVWCEKIQKVADYGEEKM